MKLYNVEKSIFADYSTIIFDLDSTIWQCFSPQGDSIPALAMEPPFTLLGGNIVQDIRHNIAKLYPDVIEVLESLDKYGLNLGIVSKSEVENVPESAQPAYMLLQKFDLLKYFTYLVVIKRHITKSDYVKGNGKTLFIDDDQEQIEDVNKRGLSDVLNRHKFVNFKDLFSESKEVSNEPQFQMKPNAPQPTTSSWRNPLATLGELAFDVFSAKPKLPKEFARKKYLDPNDILVQQTPDGLLRATSGVSFYYDPQSGAIKLGIGQTHPEMFDNMTEEEQNTFGGVQDEEGNYSGVWLGRCTSDKKLVVFWSPEHLSYVDDTDILAHCLMKLVEGGVLLKNGVVGFANDPTSKYSTIPELLHTQGSLRSNYGSQAEVNRQNSQTQENQTSSEQASQERKEALLTFADAEVIYPTVQDIEDVHTEVIETWGGSAGYYDNTIAKIEAAIGRMQSGGFGQEFYPSLEEKAAILMHSIASSHVFVDGNKRTGYFAGLFFLEENGLTFPDSASSDPGEGHVADELLAISEGRKEGQIPRGHEGLHSWLQTNVQSHVPELEEDDIEPQASLKFSDAAEIQGWISPEGKVFDMKKYGIRVHDVMATYIIDHDPELKKQFEVSGTTARDFLHKMGWVRVHFTGISIGNLKAKHTLLEYVSTLPMDRIVTIEYYENWKYRQVFEGTVAELLDKFDTLNFGDSYYAPKQNNQTQENETTYKGHKPSIRQSPDQETQGGVQETQRITQEALDYFHNAHYKANTLPKQRKTMSMQHPEYATRMQAALNKPFERWFGEDSHKDLENKAAQLVIQLTSPKYSPYTSTGLGETALVSLRYFLAQNGYTFDNLPDLTDVIWNLVSDRLDEKTAYNSIVAFLDNNLKPLDEDEYQIWEKGVGKTASMFTFAEDPLTYTDKSDTEEGNQRGRYEVFHQDDHFEVDNGRDHAWGEPWEPINQQFLDPNIVPTLDDKRKISEPNQGGITTSNMQVTAVGLYAYVDALVTRYVTQLMYSSTLSDEEIAQEVTLMVTEDLEGILPVSYDTKDIEHYIMSKVTTIMQRGTSKPKKNKRNKNPKQNQYPLDRYNDFGYGDIYGEVAPGYGMGGGYGWDTSKYEEYRKQMDEKRAAEDKLVLDTIPQFLLKKFTHEQFSVKSLVKLMRNSLPNAGYISEKEIESAIRALPVNDPKNFHLNGTLLYIGDIANKPESDNLSLNVDELKDIVTAKIEDFAPYGDSVENTPDGMYVFKDNGSDVLAIAHLDTVQELTHFDVSDQDETRVIKNAQLDDRLGAYIILKLLPQMGVNCDILLTEGEESGKSTALHFKPTKKYNWVFSFDRKGMDVVMYQYDDAATTKQMDEAGFVPNKGSFSDIAFVEHLGVKGFNFGTGYYGEHDKSAHAIESHVLHNVRLFKQFYDKYKDTLMPHTNTGKYEDRRNPKPKSKDKGGKWRGELGDMGFGGDLGGWSSMNTIDIDGRAYKILPHRISSQLSGSMGAMFEVKKRDGEWYAPVDRYDDLVEQTEELIREFSSLKLADIVEDTLHSEKTDYISIDNWRFNFNTQKFYCTSFTETGLDNPGDLRFNDGWQVKLPLSNMWHPLIPRFSDEVGVAYNKWLRNKTASLKFSIDLPRGESYPDYSGTMDVSPKDPKHQDELEEPWAIREDLGKRYFETNEHDTVMRPESDRPATPFASLKLADIVEQSMDDVVTNLQEFKDKCRPNQLWQEGDWGSLLQLSHRIKVNPISEDGYIELEGAKWCDTFEEAIEASTSTGYVAYVNETVFPLRLIEPLKRNEIASLKVADLVEDTMASPESISEPTPKFDVNEQVIVSPVHDYDLFSAYEGFITDRFLGRDNETAPLRWEYTVENQERDVMRGLYEENLSYPDFVTASLPFHTDIHLHKPNSIITHQSVSDALTFAEAEKHNFILYHETQDDSIYKPQTQG